MGQRAYEDHLFDDRFDDSELQIDGVRSIHLGQGHSRVEGRLIALECGRRQPANKPPKLKRPLHPTSLPHPMTCSSHIRDPEATLEAH